MSAVKSSPSQLAIIATCSLNQWGLDYEGNCLRIIESIKRAKNAGATLRIGPELEICGPDCADSFLEGDLYLHSWEMMARILSNKECYGILLDIGMPVIYQSSRYICRVYALDGEILLIVPQTSVHKDRNYSYHRYFSTWPRESKGLYYKLPSIFSLYNHPMEVPFGRSLLVTSDISIGTISGSAAQIKHAYNELASNRIDIIAHGSRSYHQLGEAKSYVNSLCEITKSQGGIHIYSNFIGCGGDRLFYDGCSMIISNGKVLAQGPRFSLNEIEVIVATVNLRETRRYTTERTGGLLDSSIPKVTVPFNVLCNDRANLDGSEITESLPIETCYLTPAEEIALGPALWLWDYVRRSNLAGFLLPLSGGIDSCSTALIVYSLCRLLIKGIKLGVKCVISDVARIAGAYEKEGWMPTTAQELCHKLLHTVYMGIAGQSSEITRFRAESLHAYIGSYHLETDLDPVFQAYKDTVTRVTSFEPQFGVLGGRSYENLALQNLQARIRMVTAYQFGQLLPTIRNRKGSGNLLVLGSTNSDEVVRGNYTRYDCSSADINPIGTLAKSELYSFVSWARTEFSMPGLEDFVHASPTAELEPITELYTQSDELDLGMTYEELFAFNYCRTVLRLGPYSTFRRLAFEWQKTLSQKTIATKVKKFFFHFSMNRHKVTTLTPAYHATPYSAFDNKCDVRQMFMTPISTSYPFKRIDVHVKDSTVSQPVRRRNHSDRGGAKISGN